MLMITANLLMIIVINVNCLSFLIADVIRDGCQLYDVVVDVINVYMFELAVAAVVLVILMVMMAVVVVVTVVLFLFNLLICLFFIFCCISTILQQTREIHLNLFFSLTLI